MFDYINDYSIAEIIVTKPKDTFFYIATAIIQPLLMQNYTYWLLLVSAVYMYPLTRLINKYSVNPMYSWVVFIFLGMFLFIMAGIRQTVAMGILIFGFINLLKGKNIIFWISLFIAYLFHGASLIFILVYPIVRFRIHFSIKSLILYTATILIFLAFGKSLLPYVTEYLGQQDARYISYGEEMKGATLTYFIQQLIILIPSLYYLRNQLNNKIIAIFAHISMLALVFASLSPAIAELFRLSMFFSWADIILFPLAMKEAQKHNATIPYIYLAFFALYLIFINKTLINEYYFWFEDTSRYIINNYYWLS